MLTFFWFLKWDKHLHFFSLFSLQHNSQLEFPTLLFVKVHTFICYQDILFRTVHSCWAYQVWFLPKLSLCSLYLHKANIGCVKLKRTVTLRPNSSKASDRIPSHGHVETNNYVFPKFPLQSGLNDQPACMPLD